VAVVVVDGRCPATATAATTSTTTTFCGYRGITESCGQLQRIRGYLLSVPFDLLKNILRRSSVSFGST